MAEFDVNSDVLDEISSKMDGLATSDLPQVDRAGLRAVNAYAKPALESVTPVAAVPPTPGSTALPQGALKASVRARVVQGDSRGQAAVIDFGKNSYVANFVDSGTVRSAANPFIRRLQDSPAFQAKAQEEYIAAVDAEVQKVLNGK